eukprot:GEMP01098474.1.p1 GENE.GEMP01098474.1~~GEMP01098474.1.p1  ORF type:complete len:101 (+),score=6.28 GEMP01098474.1:243-545(+)
MSAAFFFAYLKYVRVLYIWMPDNYKKNKRRHKLTAPFFLFKSYLSALSIFLLEPKKDGTENRIAGLDGVFFCGVYRGKVKLTAKENYKIKKKRTKRLLWL